MRVYSSEYLKLFFFFDWMGVVVATPFLWTGCGLGGGVNGEFEGYFFAKKIFVW